MPSLFLSDSMYPVSFSQVAFWRVLFSYILPFDLDAAQPLPAVLRIGIKFTETFQNVVEGFRKVYNRYQYKGV